MFGKLLWKEWKENLWKLCFCCAAGLGFTAILFRIRVVPDTQNCYLMSVVLMFIVPIIYALDIFSGEMSNKTIHLLFKIPVERTKIFFSKYLVSMIGMGIVFLATGLLMEVMGHGREMPVLFLFKTNILCGISAMILFTWFTVFGCQSRSEAGSLAVMFAVFVGWGIILLWSNVCEVTWASGFVPYWLVVGTNIEFDALRAVVSQAFSVVCVLGIACYRYSSIRRYL